MRLTLTLPPGQGGQKGSSSNALARPGAYGRAGKTGSVKVTCMSPNGSQSDLEATQVFAFSEQYQMLLRQADLTFFNNVPSEKERASTLYQLLLSRLGFVKKANFGDQDSSTSRSHDYDAAKVATLDDARSEHVWSRQTIQNDHHIGDTAGKSSIAAIGPFTMWKVVVPTGTVNQGLRMEGVKKAYLEFRGTSRSAIVAN